jgi:hypothetical protein
MILTIKQILDSFEGDIPKIFKDSLGTLDPTDEITRKEVPARLLRFEEGETAIVGVISDLRKDRDDEVVLPEGMDDKNYSGVVLWQHDYWREDIPHARSLYREVLPKSNPYQIIAKTKYLVGLSDLGFKVYEYRKDENPMGQSIGFRARERLRRGETGYDDLYKEWVKRVKAMLKAEKIKATDNEFSEPYAFITKWELWEYSDVFIGSNPDALQIAVSKGIVTPAEAKRLADFTPEDPPDEEDKYADMLKRIQTLEAQIAEFKKDGGIVLEETDIEAMWDSNLTNNELMKMWENTTE